MPEGSTSAVTSSISKLTADLIEAQARRIGLEAALKQIAQLKAANLSLDAVPQFASDPMIIGLNSQISVANNELGRLRQQYKEGHPEIQKLLLQVDAGAEGEGEAGTRRSSPPCARTTSSSRSARRSCGEPSTPRRRRPPPRAARAAELDAIKKEAESAKGLYDVLLQKLNETDIAASIRSNNVSVVERASPPTSPIRPNKKRIAAVAGLLGLLLGVGLVLARDYLDNTIKDPEEIERYLHIDLLARRAPIRRGQRPLRHRGLPEPPHRPHLRPQGRAGTDRPRHRHRAPGRQDDDARQPRQAARLLGREGRPRGLRPAPRPAPQPPGADARAGSHELLREPRGPGHPRAPDPGAEPVRADTGPLPPNPPAILTRPNMPDFLDRLRDHFSWVLIDSPPLASVTDAQLLARYADLTTFVVQYNKADKKLIRRNLTALRKVTDTVLGVVLNAVNVRAKGYYYYYYPHDMESSKVPNKPNEAKPAEPRSRKPSEDVAVGNR